MGAAIESFVEDCQGWSRLPKGWRSGTVGTRSMELAENCNDCRDPRSMKGNPNPTVPG